MSSYAVQIGHKLAKTLEEAISAQQAVFAGYCANIDFWFDEYEHLLAVLSGYEERYQTMKRVHDEFIAMRGTPEDPAPELRMPYRGVQETTSLADRNSTANSVRTALQRMLKRGLKEGLLDFEQHDDLMQKLDAR